jgi:ABC-2 type transport system permease protein
MISYFTNVLAGDRLPPAALPVPLFALSLAIPLTYAFDGLRHALLGTTPILPFVLEAAILVAFAVGMTALGLWALSAADRRSRRLGTLAHH